MTERCRFVLTEDGRLDLSAYQWDDHRFTDLMTRAGTATTDTAMSISRHLRKEIDKIEERTITMSVIEKIIDDKLQEFGLDAANPVKLDVSVFKKKGPILSGNAKTVLERRYLKKDPNGKVIESPDKMFRRVARHIAKAELAYGSQEQADKMEDAFYNLMTEFRFLPNSPTLMNAGRRLGQLAACFVLPVEDSMEAIFNSLHHAAMNLAGNQHRVNHLAEIVHDGIADDVGLAGIRIDFDLADMAAVGEAGLGRAETAEGLEEGKTKVKMLSVEVGLVEEVEMRIDQRAVRVDRRLDGAESLGAAVRGPGLLGARRARRWRADRQSRTCTSPGSGKTGRHFGTAGNRHDAIRKLPAPRCADDPTDSQPAL